MIKIQELRDQLVEEYGIDKEIADSSKKPELLAMLNNCQDNRELNEGDSLETFFGDLEIVTEEVEEAEEEPSYNSVEWSDFVLTKFAEDELIEGNPNVNGLRRVTNELLGEIIKSVPVTLVPCMGGFACSYEVHIIWNRTPDGQPGFGEYGGKVFGGVADATENNTDKPYSDYLAAMAETRAEVRALRKALRLKGVAHEEVKTSYREEQTVSWDSGDAKITAQQLSLIRNKCESLGIDVEKFAQTRGDTLENLKKDDGSVLIQDINQYQTQHKEVPEELRKDNE